jgi:hypothetical protein
MASIFWDQVLANLWFYPSICLKELKKKTTKNLRIDGLRAETLTHHLSKTKQKRNTLSPFYFTQTILTKTK